MFCNAGKKCWPKDMVINKIINIVFFHLLLEIVYITVQGEAPQFCKTL